MDNVEQPAFSSFDPDDDTDGIDQPRIEGWVKITSPRGGVQVLKVRTVKILERWSLEVIRPGREEYPLYKSGFLWNSIERIPEHEALAFLAKRNAPRLPPEEASHE